ncbi:MAG: hypothetical protein WCO96_04615 [Actinomycetes bacterium]
MSATEASGRSRTGVLTAGPPSTWESFRAILASDLHFHRASPLIWGGSLGATCALVAAIWPSVADSIGRAMQGYPDSIKKAFGITTLSNVDQYVDAEMLSLIVPLAMAWFAVRVATRSIVWAEENHHLDSLLALPISRRVLVAGSLLATALLLAASLFLMWAMTLAAATAVDAHASAATLASGFANVWPISIAFAGFGVFLAGFLHRSASVVGIAGGTLVAMYVIDLVGKISPDLKPFRVLSAFRWYGSAVQDGFDWGHAMTLTAAGLLLAVVGAELFRRRDVL